MFERMPSDDLRIDLEESFPHLKNAPISEALIDWRAAWGRSIPPSVFEKELASALPDYEYKASLHSLQLSLTPDETDRKQTEFWDGTEYRHRSEPFVVRADSMGVRLSRLSPYQSFASFADEGLRVLRAFCDRTQPPEVQRLSVRYVNRISVASFEELSEILESPVRAPEGLPVRQFLHQTQFEFPAESLRVDLVRSVPEARRQQDANLQFYIDIGVSTTDSPRSVDFDAQRKRLEDLRWMKNKTFFGILSEAGLQRLKNF